MRVDTVASQKTVEVAVMVIVVTTEVVSVVLATVGMVAMTLVLTLLKKKVVRELV
jgi:hypothetical protein